MEQLPQAWTVAGSKMMQMILMILLGIRLAKVETKDGIGSAYIDHIDGSDDREIEGKLVFDEKSRVRRKIEGK